MKKKIRIFLAILVLINLVVLCSAKSTEYLDLKWKYLSDGAVVFVHVDDLDNDGFKEVIAAASKETMIGGSGWIYVFDREGNMTWKLTGKYDLPGPISSILIDDLNNDGKKEIIVGIFSYVHVLDSDGIEEWKSRTDYRCKVISLFVDDLDNDGSKELIVGASSRTTGKLFVINENGGWEWVRPVNGEIHALYAADLYKSGFKEIIAGTVGRYGILNYPGYIQVFNSSGSEVWKYKTEKGILSLSVDDIDNDGWNEILVGCQEYFYALDNYGKEEGNSTTGGRIRAILATDLEKDGDREIILGSNDVYVLDGNFKRKWINKVGTEVYDLDVADLDGDGNVEVIVASDKLYILDKDGKERWQYSTKMSVRSVCTDDLNSDGYQELIVGSADKNVYVFQSKTYVKRLDARRYYTRANEFYLSGNYTEAKKNAEDAKRIYSELGDSKGIKECEELLENIENSENQIIKEKESAREYYEKARNAYLSGEYKNATKYAYKAKYKYLSFNMEKVEECNEIINKSIEFLKLDAHTYLENASEYFEMGDYENALLYAKKANEDYEFVKDEGGVNKSEELIVKINEAIGKKEKEEFLVKGDLITLILVGMIILALIILVILIIDLVIKRKQNIEGKLEVKVVVERPRMEVRKDEKEEKIPKEPIEKKVIKRKPLGKIVKDRFKGEGSSLRGLMGDELKEV